MSGTDYTQTPNLGLYKPVYDADDGQWGTHLNANADVLDAALGPGGAFVPIAGGTMTGPLVLSGDPTAAFGAASKNYVDGTIARAGGPFLPLSGGTLSGALALAADPASAMQPVTLQYFNAHVPTFSMAASGAAGDGITDDQPVIQAWLNALPSGGAEVLLPPGKWYYIHAASLVIPRNVTIRGAYNPKDNQYAGGSFFNCGGFLIDPALICGIIMTAATSLKQVKVYRSGLTALPGDPAAQAAYTTWAAEGVYKIVGAGGVSNGATVIPLTDTTGISIGMPLSGVASMGPLTSGTWNYRYVTAINPGVSVTLNSTFSGTLAAGAFVRFGASIGIVVTANCGGVTFEDVMAVGFRTGIQTLPGQFSIVRMMSDCITNIECTNGGSWAVIRDCLWLPLYGTPTAIYVRPGDMIFVHDCQGPYFKNCSGVGWQTGYHCENCTGVEFTDSGAEVPTALGAGIVTANFVLRGGSQAILVNAHAQGAGTGFHLDGTTSYLLYNCNSSSYQTVAANNVAHFLVENVLPSGSMYGSIIAPQTLGGYPNKLPIKFGSGTINSCNLVGPSIQDMTATATTPFVNGTLPATLNPTFRQGVVYNGNRANGGTTTFQNWWNGAIIDAGSTLTSQTIVLPPYPMDGQTLEIYFNVGVQALTFSTTDGSTVSAYSNPAAAQRMHLNYNLAQNKWFVSGVGNFLPLTGGTVTGAATFSASTTTFGATGAGNTTLSFANTGQCILSMAVSTDPFFIQQGGGTAFRIVGTASPPANYFELTPAVAGGTVWATADGSDTNITLGVNGKGTGGVRIGGSIGFNNTAPLAKPTVTGSKASNAALASLMTALAAYGLVTDSTT